MNKRLKRMLYIVFGVLVFWFVLTIWVQYAGNQNEVIIGDESANIKTLIVYNPDPIYNLDKQICVGFAKGLQENGIGSKVITVNHFEIGTEEYDLLVFCANTYNWSPDWKITSYINNLSDLSGKSSIAITVGSGSTSRAQRLLENAIKNTKANLIDSKEFWLLRPNDENCMEEKNIEVAVDMATEWGNKIGKQLNSK